MTWAFRLDSMTIYVIMLDRETSTIQRLDRERMTGDWLEASFTARIGRPPPRNGPNQARRRPLSLLSGAPAGAIRVEPRKLHALVSGFYETRAFFISRK